MRKTSHTRRRLWPAGLIGLLIGMAFATSAAATTPRVAARSASAYTRLYADFHRMLTLPGSLVKADQRRFEKSTAPCLTRALTALLVAEAPGSADAAAATAAYKPLVYEVAFQMIMQSSKPLMTPY